jgi:O-antigen biosynthesis protein WbqV
LRPGEKLYEEPLHASEELRPTEIGGILLASPRVSDHAMITRLINEMVLAATQKDNERALGLIQRLVPEYRPTDNRGGKPSRVEQDETDLIESRPLATVTDIRAAVREGMAS